MLLGPGLGGTAQSAARATETRTLVQQLLPGFAGAAVLDADGLNATAQLLAEGKPFPHPAGELVVTPHPGEMARLTGLSAAALANDRAGIALRYAKAWNAVVVLKGARTVVASPDGRVCVNPTGNPGLARGGSGDVLAGMLAALLACGLPAYQAAACAVYLHGAAADRDNTVKLLAAQVVEDGVNHNVGRLTAANLFLKTGMAAEIQCRNRRIVNIFIRQNQVFRAEA